MRTRPPIGLLGPKGISLEADLDCLAVTNTAPHLTSVVGQAAGTQRAGSSASAMNVTYANPTTTGNLLVLVISAWAGGGDATFTVTDNQGNTWVERAHLHSTVGAGIISVWSVPNANGNAALQLTITPSPSSFLSVWINEYSVTLPSTHGAVDQTNTASGNTTTPSVAVTSTVAGDLYVGAGEFDVTTSITTEGGWVNKYTQLSNGGGTTIGISVETLGDGTSQAAGATTASWTLGTSYNGPVALVAFKP